MNENNVETRTDTKQSILDAAEYLFAQEGYAKTSMRAVTGRAGVNLAAVNYHFGSKKSLLDAVLKRRLQPLNQIRKKRLEEVRDSALAKGEKPVVRDTMRALVEPTLQFREACNTRDFIVLLGRAFAEPDDTARKLFHRQMKPIFQLLFGLMKQALPEMKEEILFWRIHFAIAALFHTLRVWGSNIFDPVPSNIHTDASSMTELLVDFVTAGMEAK